MLSTVRDKVSVKERHLLDSDSFQIHKFKINTKTMDPIKVVVLGSKESGATALCQSFAKEMGGHQPSSEVFTLTSFQLEVDGQMVI